MKTYPRRAKRLLAVSCVTISCAAMAEEAEAPELSFLEFLGSMVETGEEGVWLDPLDLDNEALVEQAPAPSSDRPVARPAAQGESS